MKTTLVLALDASYGGRPSLPHDAQLWTVVMNSLNDGYAYNFIVTGSETISYTRGEHLDLRLAFGCLRPPSTSLHRFIDMATSSLNIEIPSPKSIPRPEPVEQELLDMQLDIYRRPRPSTATPVDRAYYTACSESPLFDALPSAGPAYDGEYDNAIVQMLLYGGPTRHAVSTALVIADPKSECIVTSLRDKGVVVSAPRCHNTHRSCDLDEKRFEYSSSGKYEFDEEQYDVVYIKTPSSEDSESILIISVS
ncbi:hypothetical protein OCU04_007383 [Sclerotinia nivalis]|uniref:Uncharacterized protein n=1 Tax=Sclerotinia nivalis TaxID=352851 RepID=A0A9X0AIM3_9HELO|nr:hypothetical protein OCU04_007383 [Sclerotinia nivalis]